MPSPLVEGIRALIAERVDAGVPLSSLERTHVLAALAARTDASRDTIDELEDAITQARAVLLSEPPAGLPDDHVKTVRRDATLRLLAAARACIDYDPFNDYNPTALLDHDTETHAGRKHRADIDE